MTNFIKYKHHKLSDISKEWIDSIPKTINNHGCWIPNIKPISDGYVSIRIETVGYYLHRLVVSVYENLKYRDPNWESRHSENCVKSCFNPSHLKSGTTSDNAKDAVIHKVNWETAKESCPKCGGLYNKAKRRRYGVMHWTRYCPSCRRKNDAKKYKERMILEKSL